MQTCEAGLKVCAKTCGRVESLRENLRGGVESLRENLRGGVESLRENLRGGVESLQANLRPWTHTQAFAGKWWCKFALKLAREG